MEIDTAVIGHRLSWCGSVRQRLKLVSSDARIAKALKEIPAYSRVVKRMAAKLKHCIRVS